MPALTIPACGYSSGSRAQIDSGIERAITHGGAQIGWSDYDTVRRIHTVVFGTCTLAEHNTIYAEYLANRLTGTMTFTPPWVGSLVTCDYAAEPTIEPREGVLFSITLTLREQ
jgi:hypothetical protein